MYQTIPVRYLDAWLEQGYTGRLIDLRTPEEYNVSHLCEAENIPFLWLQDNRRGSDRIWAFTDFLYLLFG